MTTHAGCAAKEWWMHTPRAQNKFGAAQIAIVLAVMTTTISVARAGSEERERIKRLSDEVIGDRRVAVLPVKPTQGIPTGTVIAYGHPIPPPYEISYSSDGRLSVNGVQVSPSIPRERHSRERPPESAAIKGSERRAGELIQAARRLYDASAHSDSNATHETIIQQLLSHPDVITTAAWQRESFCYFDQKEWRQGK